MHYLCKEAKEQLLSSIVLPSENEFTTKNASSLAKGILEQIKSEKGYTIFFIFDEIENISRRTSPSAHWATGMDFVLFWQTLRSIFQYSNNLISYLIVGTNPSCIEMPKIEDVDNPIFKHFTPMFIPGFGDKETKEMVRKLGRKMGLEFDDSVYTKLTEDFGGHPFLIRQVCSVISSAVEKSERPTKIDRQLYWKAKKQYLTSNSGYFEMIIGVLKIYYNDEYEMLKMLANDDIQTFNEFASLHPSYTAHLLGYGLIKTTSSGYDFCIDSIKEYLVSQHRYINLSLSMEEKWAEISERRNAAEQKLRKMVKSLLKSHLSEQVARDTILAIYGEPRKTKLSNLNYTELFDPNKSEIYFSDLAKVISKHWDVFKNMFSKTKKDVFEKLEFINHSRSDAHAKKLTEDQFVYFRICMSGIEEDMQDW